MFWRASPAHLADIGLAARVSGGLRGGFESLAHTLLRNLADAVLFAVLAGLALRRTRRFRDVLFYGFCAGAGFLLLV